MVVWDNKGGAPAPPIITTIIYFMKGHVNMAKIFRTIAIVLDIRNVKRLKEFKNYKANEITIGDGLQRYITGYKSCSRPSKVVVALIPLKLQPVVQKDGTFLWGYNVTHIIEYGSNGLPKEEMMRRGSGYVTGETKDAGVVWLAENEIELLEKAEDPGYFFSLFGEAEKNDN